MVTTEAKRITTQADELWEEATSLLATHQHNKKEYAGNNRVIETPDLHVDSTYIHDFLYLSGNFTNGNLSEITFNSMDISGTHGIHNISITMKEGEQIAFEQVQKMRARIAFLNAGLNEELDHKPKRSFKGHVTTTRGHHTPRS